MPTLSNQSKAQQNIGAGYAFLPIIDLLILKVVTSHVTWASSVPILVFLGLSVLDLGPMYATDIHQTSDAHHRLMAPPCGGGDITTRLVGVDHVAAGLAGDKLVSLVRCIQWQM